MRTNGFAMKRKGLWWPIWLPVVFVVLLLSAQTAGAIIIDTFATSQPLITAGPAPGNIPPGPAISVTSTATTVGADIIGGDRIILLDMTTAVVGESADAKVTGGDFSNNFDTTAQGHVHLQYNGSTTPDTFGLGANLCAGSKFVVTFATNDHAINYTMFVYTDAGNWSSRTINVPAGIVSDTIVNYDFALFTVGAGTGADFCNVGEIELHWDTDVDNQPALDMSLRQIEVPDELAFGCNYKTFDGQSFLNLPPSTVLPKSILAEVSISNTGIGSIPIGGVTITDTLDPGLTYLGPTAQISGPAGMIIDPPDSVAGQVVTWTNKVAFPAGATVVFQYPVQVDAGLVAGQILENGVLVEVSGLPDSNCSARVSIRPETTVPSMNVWGILLAVLGVTLGGTYLYRRRAARA
jgi:uncharacterized repeat protein (TIGR01451 family)